MLKNRESLSRFLFDISGNNCKIREFGYTDMCINFCGILDKHKEIENWGSVEKRRFLVSE